nr:basic proline-rich protein-like [Quercus suber]
MATNSNQALLSTLFLALIFLNFPAATRPDNACLYPCYPPPTSPGNTPTTPAATTPPPPPSHIESYPPPAGYNPTGIFPKGFLPALPFISPSGAPPPPDPILPYFPYYFREPLYGEVKLVIVAYE